VRLPRRSPRERFDVVFYAPWASSLVGGSSVGGAAGGAETQLLMLARELAARGLRVAMIVVGNPSELPATHQGVRIVAQPPRRRSRRALGRALLALGALRAMSKVRTEVLIQRNAGPTTGVAALVARLRGARFVYSSASAMDFEFDRHDARALNVKLYEWGVRHAWEVIVQNGDQARLCRERFGRDPVVIKSIAASAAPRTHRPEAFLWVGRLQAVKAPLPYLALARALPEASFWMIAVPQEHDPPDLSRAVADAVRDLPNLELLEPRSRAGVGELLDRTVAVVNTSEREGLPNVFLEGWARGVPALALSFDPDGLIAGHGLGSFSAGDTTRFEEEARRLWSERDDQSEVAARCIAYVRGEHDKDAVVERWIALARLSSRAHG
jgi:glycosyltransferase involved in cell wall biosynthesis